MAVTPPLRVLAIGAHPDDAEIGCGGTLLRHRDRGDEVMLLTLSAGAQGGDVLVREDEVRAAAAMIGASFEVHHLPDTQIAPDQMTIGIIARAIDLFAPTHVYTHCDLDTHQDHRAVHAASLVAGRNVANLLCYQAPSTTPSFVPTVFNDVSSTIDRKLELIGCFRSQTELRGYLAPDLIRATARYWARFPRREYVEPFRPIRMSGF